jgi:hypothetical protein
MNHTDKYCQDVACIDRGKEVLSVADQGPLYTKFMSLLKAVQRQEECTRSQFKIKRGLYPW